MGLLRSNSVLVPVFFSLPLLLSRLCRFSTGVLYCLASLLPFLLYLLLSSRAFCPARSSLLGTLFACNGKTVYSYVEEKYWNVSLFGYYQLHHVVVVWDCESLDTRLLHRHADSRVERIRSRHIVPTDCATGGVGASSDAPPSRVDRGNLPHNSQCPDCDSDGYE